jgi:hypothetical protein
MLLNQSNFNPFEPNGLRVDLGEQLGERVINHRNRFARLMYGRYMEFLPTTIAYWNKTNDERVKVDWVKVEFMLRCGYRPVIGETKAGFFRLLGYISTNQSPSEPMNMMITQPLTKKDITFIIDERLVPDTMIELTYQTRTIGNFIVLRNKTFDYTSDMEIVLHYINELAENVATRYSLKIQSKATTVFRFYNDSQTAQSLVSRIYNGDPAITGNKSFDPAKDIVNIDFTDYASKTPELKRDYQNSLNELNAMLGFSTLGVDKEAGVNETESNSGKAFSTANGNVYLKARQNQLNLLNDAYDLELYAVYDDSAITTLMLQSWLVGKSAGGFGGDDNEGNGDTGRSDQIGADQERTE